MKRGARQHIETGASLIEVLVSMVILLVGLLGLAGMMVRAQQSQLESYQREQALVILQDMVSRLTANPGQASCYLVTTDPTDGSPFLGTGYAGTPTCGTAPVTTAQQRAVADLLEWSSLLKGAAESDASGNVGAIIGARGCISLDAAGIYWVTVTWQGVGKTSAPSMACANGLFGDETQRRAISVPVKILS